MGPPSGGRAWSPCRGGTPGGCCRMASFRVTSILTLLSDSFIKCDINTDIAGLAVEGPQDLLVLPRVVQGLGGPPAHGGPAPAPLQPLKPDQ